MDNDDRLQKNMKDWLRYNIKPQYTVVENCLGDKSLRLYYVGKEALDKIAEILMLKINSFDSARWVVWDNGDIKVVIFE